jgi:hypothetical protein
MSIEESQVYVIVEQYTADIASALLLPPASE